jgi:DNA-damage-inducible protein J
MAASTTIQLRTDPDVKVKADALFKGLGITLSDAINLFLRQSIHDQALPFQPKMSNPVGSAETVSAFDAFMQFPRKKLPVDFDEKKELMEALDERFDRAD